MVEQRSLLGGRYVLERPLASGKDTQRFFALEAATGKHVVLSVVEPVRLSTLEPAKGVKHRHLAGIVEVLKDFEPTGFPPETEIPSGAGVVVAEHVPGKSLRAVLENGKLPASRVVAWTLRLVDALQALHHANAVHGAISPRSIIAEPAKRPIAPVLSQLVAPPVGAFCPPERLKGAAETASDDVWGLYATLYMALTGVPPFFAPTREALLRVMLSKPKPLANFGVNEPVLQEILQRGLLPDRHARATDLTELTEALDAWERDPTKPAPKRQTPPRPALRGLGDIVTGALGPARDDAIVIDDVHVPDDQGLDLPEGQAPHAAVVPLAPSRQPMPPAPSAAGSVSPAPRIMTPAALPPSTPEALSQRLLTPPLGAPAPAVVVPSVVQTPPKRPSFNPFEKKRTLWPWLVAAAVAGGGGVYLAVAPESSNVAAASAQPPTPPPEPPKTRPSAPKKSPQQQRDMCVASHFPPDAFEGQPNFGFVCEDSSFVDTTRRLHDMVRPSRLGGPDGGAPEDAGAPEDIVRGNTSKTPLVGLGLDWYELPATAIIRKTCCPSSIAVSLPETPGWCEQLQTVVRRMADDSERSVDLAPGARNFDRAVSCLFANKVQKPYPFANYAKPPSEANRRAFQQFLNRAAVISAQK